MISRLVAVRLPRRRTVACCLLLTVALLLGPSLVAAQDDDLEGTVDELMEETLADVDATGATVAVVEDGELAYTQGYGYADAATQEPVDANETAFRMGSISKLFVWSAIAEAEADGHLDREEPIDTYLEDDAAFEGSDQITLNHLATHSAGYEERFEGLFREEPVDADDWEAILEEEMPAQVRAPGETIAYSNHGTALAALVLQDAVDEPFADHVDREFFDPLEMTQTSFDQPSPYNRSQGHTPDGTPHDPATISVPPAGSMSGTAPDLANYATAMLDNGTYANEQVLTPESVDLLTTERASNHPGVGGVGFGYITSEYRGEDVVWHDGGTEFFHSGFALFPEHDVAFIASFNTPTNGHVVALDRFVDDRFDEPANREPDPATADRADEYEGEYRTIDASTTRERLIGLQLSWTVEVDDDGTVWVDSMGTEETAWAEVEPGVFEPLDPSDEAFGLTSIAIEDDRLYPDAPLAPAERLSWYETTTVQGWLALGALGLTLSTLVVWPLAAYRRHGFGNLRAHATAPRVAVAGAVGLGLTFVVGVVIAAVATGFRFGYPIPLALELALGLLVVFGLAAVVALALIAREWGRLLTTRDWEAVSTNATGLAYLSVVGLALATLLWQLWYWNLLTAAF